MLKGIANDTQSASSSVPSRGVIQADIAIPLDRTQGRMQQVVRIDMSVTTMPNVSKVAEIPNGHFALLPVSAEEDSCSPRWRECQGPSSCVTIGTRIVRSRVGCSSMSRREWGRSARGNWATAEVHWRRTCSGPRLVFSKSPCTYLWYRCHELVSPGGRHGHDRQLDANAFETFKKLPEMPCVP